MQHTDKYQLNLIETSDTFSPAPLNENMEKVEAQFQAESAARGADVAALDQRIQILEARKIVVGTYTGNKVNGLSTQFIDLGFTPRAVLVQIPSSELHLALESMPFATKAITIVEGGFQLATSNSLEHYAADVVYSFMAVV